MTSGDQTKKLLKQYERQHGGISIIYFKTPGYKGLSSFLLHLPLSLAPQDHFSARLRIARPHVSLESEACWSLPSLPSLLSGVLKTGFAALFHPGEDEPPLEIVEWCEEGAFGPHAWRGFGTYMSWSVTEPSRQRPYISGWDEFLTGTSPKYTNPSEIRFLTLSKMKHHPIGSGCWLQESTGRNLQQCILNRLDVYLSLFWWPVWIYIYIHIKL